MLFRSPNNRAFLADFTETIRPFIRAGLVNSLTQTIVKLAAPGVPDIYQGSEGIDLSLVDPDNRREPDFGMLQKRLAEEGKLASGEAEWQSGRLKQQVIAALLHLRQVAPTLFRKGEYLPLEAIGKRKDNIVAFARAEADDALIVIAPRLVLEAFHAGLFPAGTEWWGETEITLPPKLANRRYRDIRAGGTIDPQERIAVAPLFGEYPFALLLAE